MGMIGSALAAEMNPLQLKRYEHIAGQLRCVVCQGQSVLDSEAEIAKEFKMILQQKLLAGETDAMIETYFYERYGDFVFLKPRKTTETFALWVAPVIVFTLLCAGLFWRRIRNSN